MNDIETAENKWKKRLRDMRSEKRYMERLECCDTCKWFDTDFTYILVGGHGWCRRYPPNKDEFPRIYKHSWCGEYKEASPEQIQSRPAIKELTDEKTQELTKIVMSASNDKKPHGWYDEILHKVGIKR